jgi:hypothetical protein
MFVSPDVGTTWYKQPAVVPQWLNGVGFGDNLFVAVGPQGGMATSPDGTNWTLRASGTTSDLFGVAYGAGVFVAVGAAGTVLNSPDGITWTDATSGLSVDLHRISFNAGIFVCLGGSDPNHRRHIYRRHDLECAELGRSGRAGQFFFCKFVEHQTEGGFWQSMLR